MAGDRFRFCVLSRNLFAGLFSYCAQTSLKLRGVDATFRGYDLCPNILPSTLWPLCGDIVVINRSIDHPWHSDA